MGMHPTVIHAAFHLVGRGRTLPVRTLQKQSQWTSASSPVPLLPLLPLASLHSAPSPRLLLPAPVHLPPSLPVEFQRLTGTQLSWFLITLLSLHFSDSIKPLPGLNEAWTLQKSHLLSGRLGAGAGVGRQTCAAGQKQARLERGSRV